MDANNRNNNRYIFELHIIKIKINDIHNHKKRPCFEMEILTARSQVLFYLSCYNYGTVLSDRGWKHHGEEGPQYEMIRLSVYNIIIHSLANMQCSTFITLVGCVWIAPHICWGFAVTDNSVGWKTLPHPQRSMMICESSFHHSKCISTRMHVAFYILVF